LKVLEVGKEVDIATTVPFKALEDTKANLGVLDVGLNDAHQVRVKQHNFEHQDKLNPEDGSLRVARAVVCKCVIETGNQEHWPEDSSR